DRVDFDYAAKIGGRHVAEILARHGARPHRVRSETGIVDEHVEPAETRERRADDRFGALIAPDIGREDRDALARAARLGIAPQALEHVRVDVAGKDAQPRLDEAQGHGPADAAPRTGNDRNLAALLCRHAADPLSPYAAWRAAAPLCKRGREIASRFSP